MPKSFVGGNSGNVPLERNPTGTKAIFDLMRRVRVMVRVRDSRVKVIELGSRSSGISL